MTLRELIQRQKNVDSYNERIVEIQTFLYDLKNNPSNESDFSFMITFGRPTDIDEVDLNFYSDQGFGYVYLNVLLDELKNLRDLDQAIINKYEIKNKNDE